MGPQRTLRRGRSASAAAAAAAAPNASAAPPRRGKKAQHQQVDAEADEDSDNLPEEEEEAVGDESGSDSDSGSGSGSGSDDEEGSDGADGDKAAAGGDKDGEEEAAEGGDADGKEASGQDAVADVEVRGRVACPLLVLPGLPVLAMLCVQSMASSCRPAYLHARWTVAPYLAPPKWLAQPSRAQTAEVRLCMAALEHGVVVQATVHDGRPLSKHACRVSIVWLLLMTPSAQLSAAHGSSWQVMPTSTG